MSRNLRHKAGGTPAQKPMPSRPPISVLSSDDDDYAGVDQISESEEDEPDVEEAEEQAIIESEDEMTPRPYEEVTWEGILESQESLDDENFFEDHIARGNAPDLDAELIYYHGNATQSSDDDAVFDSGKRVHFEDSSEDSDDEHGHLDMFPDIFLDQDSIAPDFRKQIEEPIPSEQRVSSEDGSYWDYEPSGDDVAGTVEDDGEDTGEEGIDFSDSDSDSNLSGYETDLGETTDEDLPEAATFVPTRSVLRRQSDASLSEEEVAPRHSPATRKRGPKLASWVHDGRKPWCVITTSGNEMLIFEATRRFSDGSMKRPQLQERPHRHSPQTVVDSSPMLSGNVMMSAMYSTQDTGLRGQVIGPPEAFHPFINVNRDGTVSQDSSSVNSDDAIDDYDDFDVSGFLNLGPTEIEGEEDETTESPLTDDQAPAFSPARPTESRSEDQVHPLLNHFSSGVVGSFRRDKNREKYLNSNPESRRALAFEGPYNQGPIRGLKPGRVSHGNALITPMRRQKPSRVLATPSSPLASIAELSKKRKFSGQEFKGHKRNKSLF